MKNKKLTALALAGVLGVASFGMMGCKQEEAKPYIQVKGLDTTYIQNEEINLEGAKVLYYSDKNDTTADEIKLQECMIANFNTETTGKKTLKVIWNGCELEINYNVMLKSEFIDLYNTAYNNFMFAQNIHSNTNISSGSDSLVVYENVFNNKYYATSGTEQRWIQKEDNNWFWYSIEGESNKKELIMVENDNIREFVYESMFYLENEEFTTNIVDEFISWEYEINGDEAVLIFKQDGSEGLQESKLTIQNEKFVKVENKFFGENGVDVEINLITTLSYNAEDVEMVDLPTDVDWQNLA